MHLSCQTPWALLGDGPLAPSCSSCISASWEMPFSHFIHRILYLCPSFNLPSSAFPSPSQISAQHIPVLGMSSRAGCGLWQWEFLPQTPWSLCNYWHLIIALAPLEIPSHFPSWLQNFSSLCCQSQSCTPNFSYSPFPLIYTVSPWVIREIHPKELATKMKVHWYKNASSQWYELNDCNS